MISQKSKLYEGVNQFIRWDKTNIIIHVLTMADQKKQVWLKQLHKLLGDIINFIIFFYFYTISLKFHWYLLYHIKSYLLRCLWQPRMLLSAANLNVKIFLLAASALRSFSSLNRILSWVTILFRNGKILWIWRKKKVLHKEIEMILVINLIFKYTKIKEWYGLYHL